MKVKKGTLRASAAMGVITAVGVSLLSLTACGRLQDEAAEFRDPVPLPAEPMVKEVASVGRYGGRFVLGATSGPRTLNAMMANETSSSDITNQLFIGLTDFDKTTQKEAP